VAVAPGTAVWEWVVAVGWVVRVGVRATVRVGVRVTVGVLLMVVVGETDGVGVVVVVPVSVVVMVRVMLGSGDGRVVEVGSTYCGVQVAGRLRCVGVELGSTSAAGMVGGGNGLSNDCGLAYTCVNSTPITVVARRVRTASQSQFLSFIQFHSGC
jgi:hypothetical protein